MTRRLGLPVTVVLTLFARGVLAQQPSPVRLTVAEAVAQAFAASHRLAEARARQAGADATVRLRHSAERPTASASAGYSRTNHVDEFGVPRPDGGSRVLYPDLPDNLLTRLAFQWPIYTAGRADALERAAAAEANAVGSDLEQARADLRLETVRAYWAIATATEAIRVIEESVTRADAQVADARQQLAAGLVPPSDVLGFEAQRSSDRLRLIEARNQYESSLVEMRRLIGADPEAPIELADMLSPTVGSGVRPETSSAALVDEALQHRPERQALTFRIDSAEARARAAAAGRKPALAFTGGVDYANPNPRIFPRAGEWQTSWDLSVNVSWPIFDGGRTKAEAAEAGAAVVAVQERLADFEATVAADVRQRMLEVRSADAAVQAADDGVRASAEARRVIGERFSVGVATPTDVLVAQDALLNAQLARTRALATMKLAEARLARALGRPE
jgi:outer membrane protein TolC